MKRGLWSSVSHSGGFRGHSEADLQVPRPNWLQHRATVKWVWGESSELIWYEVVLRLDRSRSGRGPKTPSGAA